MNKKILALSLLLMLITVYVTSVSISSVKAVGEGQWIPGYQIYDYNSGQLLKEFNITTGVNMTYSPILPGADLKVIFTVNVFTAGSGDLKLQTSMGRLLSGTYWDLVTQNYTLGNDYNPNANPAEFTWTEGTFTMIVYGTVPTSASNTSAPVNLVSLYGPSGGVAIDQISVVATSAQLTQFQTLYDQREAHLQSLISSGVAQGYIDLYTNVLNESQSEANQGYVASAIALLNGLNVSNEPMSSTMQSLFIPIIGVLAVVAVVFVVMFLRVRGKVSYFQLVVEDQIKDLEGLTLRASKIDRTMSSSLESVKDRLKRLVGM